MNRFKKLLKIELKKHKLESLDGNSSFKKSRSIKQTTIKPAPHQIIFAPNTDAAFSIITKQPPTDAAEPATDAPCLFKLKCAVLTDLIISIGGQMRH